MLQLPIIGLFLRTIPEGILGMCAVYVFSGKKFDWKRILVCGLILGIIFYIFRSLPISFGVHTVLGLFMFILIASRFNGIQIISAITYCIIYVILLFVSEAITIPLTANIVGVPFESVLENPMMSLIFGIPSLVTIIMTLILIHFIKQRTKSSKYR